MSKSPEPIILAVALLLLAVGSALLAYFFPTTQDITGVTTTQPTGHSATLLKADDLASSLAIWDSPVLWQGSDDVNRLFASDKYLFYPSVYPAGDYIKKVTKDTPSPSGIPLWWYNKYGLDFTDSNVDEEDPDGDGFSNIVEYRNDPVGVRRKAVDCDPTKSCDPLDAKSHPDYLARLRLSKYETQAFHIQFKGYQQLNGEYLFQLYLKDVPSYNQPALKKTGDDLGFEGYKVGAFNQKFEDIVDPNTHLTVHTDVSTLELDKPDIGLKVLVTFRQEVDSPEYTASFVMLMPADRDKTTKIARGKVFTVSELPDKSFLVIEANDNGATIRDTKTNQDYHILQLDPNEWNEVPQPSTSNASK